MKTTSIKEPSVERNFELRRSARFSSRESSVIKAEEKPSENPYHHKDTKGNREAFKKNKNLTQCTDEKSNKSVEDKDRTFTG